MDRPLPVPTSYLRRQVVGAVCPRCTVGTYLHNPLPYDFLFLYNLPVLARNVALNVDVAAKAANNNDMRLKRLVVTEPTVN